MGTVCHRRGATWHTPHYVAPVPNRPPLLLRPQIAAQKIMGSKNLGSHHGFFFVCGPEAPAWPQDTPMFLLPTPIAAIEEVD